MGLQTFGKRPFWPKRLPSYEAWRKPHTNLNKTSLLENARAVTLMMIWRLVYGRHTLQPRRRTGKFGMQSP